MRSSLTPRVDTVFHAAVRDHRQVKIASRNTKDETGVGIAPRSMQVPSGCSGLVAPELRNISFCLKLLPWTFPRSPAQLASPFVAPGFARYTRSWTGFAPTLDTYWEGGAFVFLAQPKHQAIATGVHQWLPTCLKTRILHALADMRLGCNFAGAGSAMGGEGKRTASESL